jgi:hypothetical protein
VTDNRLDNQIENETRDQKAETNKTGKICRSKRRAKSSRKEWQRDMDTRVKGKQATKIKSGGGHEEKSRMGAWLQ